MDKFDSIIVNAYKLTGKTLLPNEQHLLEFFGEVPVSEDEMNEEQKIVAITEAFKVKYRVLGFLIEQLFMSASEKDTKIKFISKVVYQNSKTLRACEYQIRTMRRQFGDNDSRLTYMNQRFSIIKRGFSEINDVLVSLSKAIEKASSDRSFIFKKAFSEQSRLECEMLNVILDYGCPDAKDCPFSSPFTDGDIVMFPAGEWGPTENTRKEQARKNRKLYDQRLTRKKESIVYYYNALKPFDVCVHSLQNLLDCDIMESKIEEIEKFRADIARETLVPLFCQTMRFMDAIEKLGELRERLEEKERAAGDLYFAEDSPQYKPDHEMPDPRKLKLYSYVQETCKTLSKILGIVIQGYTEWAIHHVKTYNSGWNGKPFDIYGCNPIGLSYDYTTWEIYIETEWYEFWKRDKYVITEP